MIFGFGTRDVAAGLQQSTMVEPVDPSERGVLDSFEAAPGAAPVYAQSLFGAGAKNW
ncbi:hypothetical protein [Sphingomonas sp. Leaf34]|uniref:hypothetical protein n=1 Tax=Sphingomonas sp. Leaf34 TaxID=1736216 RepID=UPI000ABF406D